MEKVADESFGLNAAARSILEWIVSLLKVAPAAPKREARIPYKALMSATSLNPYEGMHYWLAAAKYKLTHPGLKISLVPIKNGEQYPDPPGGYDLDRARVFYDAESKKTIEIKRG